MYKIMVVDDELLLVKGLKRSLEEAGFRVETAHDGAEALSLLDRGGIDLVILDIMLPVMDGLEVCRRIRRVSDIPVIMLTARGDDVDKIVGLEIGADDYLAKPFNTRELVARIRAVLRRAGGEQVASGVEAKESIPADGSIPDAARGKVPVTVEKLNSERVLRFNGLEINIQRQEVSVDGSSVELTAREFDLLYTLAQSPGRIYTREILLEQVWGSRYYGETRVVDVYIRRLRQKIEGNPAEPRWVMTRRGAGYYFRER